MDIPTHKKEIIVIPLRNVDDALVFSDRVRDAISRLTDVEFVPSADVVYDEFDGQFIFSGNRKLSDEERQAILDERLAAVEKRLKALEAKKMKEENDMEKRMNTAFAELARLRAVTL